MRLRLSLPIFASFLAAGLLLAASPADAARKAKPHGKQAAHTSLASTESGTAAKAKPGLTKKAKHATKKKKAAHVA